MGVSNQAAPNSSFDRYKTRLIIKDFHQRSVIDNRVTFSSGDQAFSMIAYHQSCSNSWVVFLQFDVINAFLSMIVFMTTFT